MVTHRNSVVSQVYDSQGHPISALDFDVETALGNITVRSSNRKFGFNKDVGLATLETVWAAGGRYARLPAAEKMLIKSTDAADTVAGTGAQIIHVQGVDGDFNAINEFVNMNGLTNVVTALDYLVVPRLELEQAGSGEVNAGDITATAQTAATVQAQMPAGYGTTQQLVDVVPVGKKAVIKSFRISAARLAGGQSPKVNVFLYIHYVGPKTEHPGTKIIIFDEFFEADVEGFVDGFGIQHQSFSEGTVFEWVVSSNLAATVVNGHVEIVLADVT